MSESIVNALLHLFAIISEPDEGRSENRRNIVEAFLKRQLGQNAVAEYIQTFDEIYSLHQEKIKTKKVKRTSSSSVKVLKICNEINEELGQKQKVIVLLHLLEFIKRNEGLPSDQEIEFVDTVAGEFNISLDDYYRLKYFVLEQDEKLENDPNVLLICRENHQSKLGNIKLLHKENLFGEIYVLHDHSSNLYFIKYSGESELLINGQLIDHSKIQILNPGASLRNPRIKPIFYSDISRVFIDTELSEQISFDVNQIAYQFKEGKYGVRPMTFHAESGMLVGIMGASGAGKSTLLNVLNGSNAPTDGEVLINGHNLHKDQIKGLIGFVSQDDLLIEELTVFENLFYNTKLCYSNYSNEEITQLVNETLMSLGLYDIREMKVGNVLNKKISGGQRKRLNIALEIIREPAVLFLDEPTSGLSSNDSENILDLLKELTIKGKLVFVVIHQPSSNIFKTFDKLLILDEGGYLIYQGPPVESIVYFKSRIQHANWNESECKSCGNVNPEQIFNIIETRVLNEYGQSTMERKVAPPEWHQFYINTKQFNERNEISLEKKELPKINFKIPGWFSQLKIFIKRDVLAKLTNTQYIIINLFEAPIIAFFLAFLIKYFNVNNEDGYIFFENSNLPVYIFMSVIVAIFVGLSVSAEEIIKDRKILIREQFLNLSRSSYLISKVMVLLAISGLQALLFTLIGNSILEIKGMYLHYWIALFSAWASASILGLVISDTFKTAITVYILIPFIVIPQIILSGIIVRYEKLNPNISSPAKIPFYGEIITARWAYEALTTHQFMNNEYEKEFYVYDKILSQADYKKNYWIKNLQNKSDFIKRNYTDSTKTEKVNSSVQLIFNEITKELTSPSGEIVAFEHPNAILSLKNTYSAGLINQIDKYLETSRKYYILLYNKADKLKDEIVSEYQNTEERKTAFLKRKNNYENEQLNKFVKNTDDVDRIIEYKENLYQKIDPVFLDPEHNFLKAHFYAPQKKIFGKWIPTFWANILIIWISTIFFYIILYYRLLKRLLDLFNHIKKRKK